MSFCFCPKHEHGCPNVGHCPHLGGASLGTLALAADENREHRDQLHRQLDAEWERANQLFRENESLKEQLTKAKLELKLERQPKFATNQQKQADAQPPGVAPDGSDNGTGKDTPRRKRGAPKGQESRPRN